MLLTEGVYVSIGGRNIKHYSSLGYKKLVRGKKIYVPIEHLTKGSNVNVGVRCDYCGKTFKKTFKSYNRQRAGVVKKDSCTSCAKTKIRESNMIVYGVDSIMHVEKHKKTLEKTLLERYGEKNVASLDFVKQKVKTAWRKKSKSEIERIKKKTEKTNMERYGVKCPLELEENRKKLFDTLDKGSFQQKEVYKILLEFGYDNVIYNFSYSKLFLDIYIEHNGHKIDIEYDSAYWHNPTRDRRRDEFLKNKGIKVIRIKSGHKVPKKIQIKKAMEKIFSGYEYTEIVLSDWDERMYEEEKNE